MEWQSEEPDRDDLWCEFSRDDETWIHHRFDWLIETFGIGRLWHAPFVSLSSQDFPDPYAGTEEDAAILFSRICAYLEIDVRRLRLDFFSQDDPIECELAAIPFNALGLYYADEEKPTVWLDRSILSDSEALIATIAHELCHDILLGGQHLDPEIDKDHERVTDLLTIFLGMGVFTANSYLRERNWISGQFVYSSSSRHGYLSLGMLAHSLALAAWYRNEYQPPWLGHLRPDLQDLVPRNLKRLIAQRGHSVRIPDSLLSVVLHTVRGIETHDLEVPEPGPRDSNPPDNYELAVKCICPKCDRVAQFGIEFAGQTALCPHCSAYLDVPELADGRHQTLIARWNSRVQTQQADFIWEQRSLSAKWRNLFLCAAPAVGLPFYLINHELISQPTFMAYAFGICVGIGFAMWWAELRRQEKTGGNQGERT